MERSAFVLRTRVNFSEHFARSRKIKLTAGSDLLQCRKKFMGTLYVRLHGGKFVVGRITDATLGSQVVALLGLHIMHELNKTSVAFQRRAVDVYIRQEVTNTPKPMIRVLHC